jgi:membrane-associated phospholipid phosphatase
LTRSRLLPWSVAVLLSLPTAILQAADGEGTPVAAQEPAPAPEPAAAGSQAGTNQGGATGGEGRRGWDDRRRTVRSYHKNLWYNIYGVLTPGNRKPLLIGAGLTGGALLLDDEFVDYFARHTYVRFGDVGATVGGAFAVAGVTLGAFSAGRIARGGRFRASTYDVSQAIIVNGLWTFGVKLAARRDRPSGQNNQSFFSGHASNAFAGATVIERHYGPKLGIPGYTVASLIAISRMAKSEHYFSDVVAGAAFGFGVGRAVVRRNSRPPTPPGGPTPPVPKEPSTVELYPDAGPSGDGAGLRLSIRF